MRKHGVSVFGQARVSARGGGGGAGSPEALPCPDDDVLHLQCKPKGAGEEGVVTKWSGQEAHLSRLRR